MNARSAGYWTTAILITLAFLSGGMVYLYRADFVVTGIAELGYPAYFVTILGTWKLLGGLAILAPRLPRLKEWAYAGIAFDLIGATFSHVAMDHPAVKAIVPVVLLGIAAASWALRPREPQARYREGRAGLAEDRCSRDREGGVLTLGEGVAHPPPVTFPRREPSYLKTPGGSQSCKYGCRTRR